MTNLSGIYAINHIPTSRKYVGSSKHIPKRIASHKTSLDYGTHRSHKLQSAYDHDPSFEYYVLEPVEDKSKLFEREQFWIDFFDSSVTGFNTLSVAGAVPPHCIWVQAKKEAATPYVVKRRAQKRMAKRIIKQVHARMEREKIAKAEVEAYVRKWDREDRQRASKGSSI